MFWEQWCKVHFSKFEHEALEGNDDKAIINVLQDASSSRKKTMTIGYSTSDLSAIAIDKETVDNCLDLPPENRYDCGDYEQTSGPGALYASFEVQVVDN